MTLTYHEFLKCLPRIPTGTARQHYDIACAVLESHRISSRREIAMMLAQFGHESADLGTLEENLNYSVTGLMRTFPTRPWVWRFGRTKHRAADPRRYRQSCVRQPLG
ncbi:MAG: hypothetical protein HC933_02135, partial [Pleurocapsa sp. SU_196_0]|nr:hypothetical protein [Pleurocapsa sp. SU_196_0]